MIKENHPFARSARANDGAADGGMSMLDIIEGLGIDREAYMHVCDQRALRAVLVASGRINESQSPKPGKVRLDRREQAIYTMFYAAYIDGVALGWRAKAYTDEEAQEEAQK